jgi:predicted Zn-dependent protease
MTTDRDSQMAAAGPSEALRSVATLAAAVSQEIRWWSSSATSTSSSEADAPERAGYPTTTMIDTLTWLTQIERTSGGGFFATHPATSDRIEALRDVC